MTDNIKKWVGKVENCQTCNGNLGSVMYDEKTTMGPWANMCHRCHLAYGVGIGQKYRKVGGEWHKDKDI